MANVWKEAKRFDIEIEAREEVQDEGMSVYVLLQCKQSGVRGWGFGYENAFKVFAKNYDDYVYEQEQKEGRV